LTESGFRINFAQTERVKPLTSIPAGVYKAYVFDLEWGETSEESKNPGETKLKVTFKINGGPHDGRQQFRTYTFSLKSLPFFLQLAEATGKCSKAQIEGKADITPADVDNWRGAEVAISVNRKKDSQYGLEDGFSNAVRNVYNLSDPNAAKATVSPTDPRMP
jgi:hypothetical protein